LLLLEEERPVSPSAAAPNELIAQSNCRVVSYLVVLLVAIEVDQLHRRRKNNNENNERTIMAAIVRIIFAHISVHVQSREPTNQIAKTGRQKSSEKSPERSREKSREN